MTDLKSRQDTATFVDYLRNGPRFFIQQSARGASSRTPWRYAEKRSAPAGARRFQIDRGLERRALRRRSDQIRRHGRIG